MPDYFGQGIIKTGWLVSVLASLFISPLCIATESLSISPEQKVLVTVDQHPITQQNLDDAIQLVVINGLRDNNTNLKEVVLDELIVTEAMYHSAEKERLAQRDDVKRALLAMQKKLLAEAWLSDQLSKNPITDEQIKAEYDRQVRLAKSGRNANEYKVLHIVVNDESLAQQLIKRIKTGEAFDILAKTYSLDKYSGVKGGQLNWMMPDQFVEPLGNVLVTLPKGHLYPQAIKSGIGWHVIKLEDVREVQIPELEMIKSVLLRNMVEDHKTQIIESLMQKVQVQPSPSFQQP